MEPILVQVDLHDLGSWGALYDGASIQLFAFTENGWTPRGPAELGAQGLDAVDPSVPDAARDALAERLRAALQPPAPSPATPSAAGFVPADYDLVVAHSAESGTTIKTVRPKDLRWNEAIQGLRAGFKWFREETRWYRQQSRGTARPTLNLEMAAERLRQSGARVYVEPVVEVSEREAAAIKREHLLGRAERYEERADQHARAGGEALAQGRAMLERIPFGQPIHVGHHSEKSDRSYRERMGKKYEKGFEALATADHLAQRAASRESAAAALTDAALDAREAHNAFVDALLELTKAQLKRDVGAELIRTHRGDAKAASGTIFIRYKADRPDAQEVMLARDGTVQTFRAGDYTGKSTVTVGRRGDTPAAVYAALVAALPKGEATDAALTVAQDPALAAAELATYAMKRVKRAVGAQSVQQVTRPISDDMNAPRVPTVALFWPSTRGGESWEFLLRGTQLNVTYSRGWGLKTRVALREDVGAKTIPQVFEQVVEVVKATRAKYGPLPPHGEPD